jgi:hypothetical protein
VIAGSRVSVGAFRTAINMGVDTAHGLDSVAVICLAERLPGTDEQLDPAPEIGAALNGERHKTVVPRSRCGVQALGPGDGGRALVFDSATRRPGLIVSVWRPGSVLWPLRIHVTYYQGGRSSGYWDCLGVPSWDGWRLGPCLMTGIS